MVDEPYPNEPIANEGDQNGSTLHSAEVEMTPSSPFSMCFVGGFIARQYTDVRDQLIGRLFELIDGNGNGFLTAEELGAVMKNADVFIKTVAPEKPDQISDLEFHRWTKENVVAKLPGK
jgi:hypothetical protein